MRTPHGFLSNSWLVFAVACTLGLGAGSAQAQTWTNGDANYSWNDPLNWSTNSVPTSSQGAFFTGTAPGTITLDANQSIMNLNFNTGNDYTISNGSGQNTLTIGTGGISIVGAGAPVQTISANVVMAGAQSWNVGAQPQLDVSGTVNDGGYLLTLSGQGHSYFEPGSVISGSGGLTITATHVTLGGNNTYGGLTTINNAASTVTISGNNTGAGGVTLQNGTLAIGNAGALGTGTFTIDSGTTISNPNSSSITNSNNNAMNWNGSFTFGGANQGALNLGAGAITLGANVTVTSSATYALTVGGTITASGAYTLTNKTGILIVNGSIQTGAGGVTNTSGTLTLAGANTYTGTTTLTAGTLKVGIASTTSGSGASETITSGATGTGLLTVNGGTLDLSTFNLSVAGLSGSGGSIASSSTSTAGSLTIVATGTHTYSGTIANTTGSGSQTVSVTVAGSGTQILAGTNTYTGNTTVNGGTLSLTGSLSSSSMLVVGGGTFSFANTTSSQTMAGLSVNAGASVVTNTNAGATPVLTLGIITRNVGATVDFSTATASTNEVTTTFSNVNGIIGGWATQGGMATWAVAGGGSATAITGLASGSYYTTTTGGNTAGNYATTANVDVTSAPTLSGAITVNTLRFNTAAAETLTLTGTNVVSSGGILVTANVGANLSTITGGTLEGAAGADLVVTQANTSGGLTINSVIADNSSATALTKSGAGLLTLSGANSYTGGTYVNAGTLQVGVASTTSGSGAGMTITSSVLGTGLVTVNGGTLDLSTFNLAVPGLSGSGGTIASSSTSTAGSLTIIATGTQTYSGTIADTTNGGNQTVSLTVAGSGTQILAGTNTYSGTTTITSGTLQFATPGSLYNANTASWTAANILVSSGATFAVNVGGPSDFTTGNVATLLANLDGAVSNNGLQAGSTIGFDTTNARSTVTLSSVIADTTGTGGGSIGVVKLGPNMLALTNVNTYSGGTTINAGTLQIGSAGSLGAGSYSGAISIAGGATLEYSSSAAQTFSGIISGSGALIKDTSTSATLTLSGANTYSGGTTLSAGTVQVGVASTTSGSGAGITITNGATGIGLVTVNGGTLDLSTYNLAVAGLSGSGGTIASSSTSTAGSLTIVATGTHTYSGTIADTTGSGNQTVSLTVAGSGTQILAGANTYSGGTTINSGTLTLNGSLSATGALVITTNGALAGTGTVNGNATIDTNGIINFGVGGNIVGTLSATGGNWNGQGSVGGVITMTGGNTFTIGSGANLTANNDVNVGAASGDSPVLAAVDGTSTITIATNLNYNSDANSTFQGVIAGIGNLNVNGGLDNPSTLTLSGASTFSGSINVGDNGVGGTLVVTGTITGTSNFSVGGGGTLAGTGTITTTSDSGISSGGTIRGGVPNGNTPAIANYGTLTINNSNIVGNQVESFPGGTIITEVYRNNGATYGGNTFSIVGAPSTPVGNSSLIALTGTANIFHLGDNNSQLYNQYGGLNLSLLDTTGSSLVVGESYTINIVQAPSFTLNGANLSAGAQVDSGGTLTSGTGVGTIGNVTLTVNNAAYAASITSWSLAIDSTGNFLQLTVNSQASATPERRHILLICVSVLLVGFRVRCWTKRTAAAA